MAEVTYEAPSLTNIDLRAVHVRKETRQTWFTYVSVTLFRVSPDISRDILTSSGAVNTNKQQSQQSEMLTFVLKPLLLWEVHKLATYLKCCRLK